MNHIVTKCNLDRGCIDYFTHRATTWSQDTLPRAAELNRVAVVESFTAGIGDDHLFGFLKLNSGLEFWLLKLCLLRGRRYRFVDFGLGP